MTSSNGNIFRVTGLSCGEFTGHRWISLTKASDAELWCFLWFAPWMNGWVNNREAGDLRRNNAHYDVIVMRLPYLLMVSHVLNWILYANGRVHDVLSWKRFPHHWPYLRVIHWSRDKCLQCYFFVIINDLLNNKSIWYNVRCLDAPVM